MTLAATVRAAPPALFRGALESPRLVLGCRGCARSPALPPPTMLPLVAQALRTTTRSRRRLKMKTTTCWMLACARACRAPFERLMAALVITTAIARHASRARSCPTCSARAFPFFAGSAQLSASAASCRLAVPSSATHELARRSRRLRASASLHGASSPSPPRHCGAAAAAHRRVQPSSFSSQSAGRRRWQPLPSRPLPPQCRRRRRREPTPSRRPMAHPMQCQRMDHDQKLTVRPLLRVCRRPQRIESAPMSSAQHRRSPRPQSTSCRQSRRRAAIRRPR